MTYRISFPAAALAAMMLTGLGAGASAAQDAPCSHPSCRATPATGAACRIYMEAGTGRARFSRTALQGPVSFLSRDQPDGCMRNGTAYALQGWRFNNRGGHKVERLQLLQMGSRFDIAFEDGDGGDYIDGFVWLVPLPDGVQVQSVQARECSGTCELDLPDVREGDTVVLAGFDLARIGGDGHVRELGIGPARRDDDGTVMPVTFRDDDFAYRVTVQYAVLPSGSALGGFDDSSEYAREGVPNLLSARYIHPDLQVPGLGEARVLRGFRFAFQNGGHFLEDVGIEPLPNGFMAWFQDNQPTVERRLPDDPFNWTVDWVSVN